MNELLKQISAIVRQAGGMIRTADTQRLTIAKKGSADFVTDLDSSIQEFLVDQFRRILPDAGFIGEEDGLCDTNHDDVFIIDPIDGTINMIFGGSYSCVSVGLERHGELVLGVVYNPYLEEMYTAYTGGGAFLNGQPLKPADNPLGKGLAFFGCAREKGSGTPAFFAMLRKLYDKSLGIRNGGAAALGLCQIAKGGSVAYLELELMPHDCAAATVIIREAGGIVTRADGSPLTMDAATSIIAGMPTAYQETRDIYEQNKEG